MLGVSDLPDILVTQLGGTIPSWMVWAKTGFLSAFFVLTLASKAVRPLWQYAAIFLTLFLALGVTGVVRHTDWFQRTFNDEGVSFFAGYAAIFVLDILVALAVLAVLGLMRRDRKAFFFLRGQMDAPIGPVRSPPCMRLLAGPRLCS